MICPQCSIEFEPRRWSAKYCSPKCQHDHGRPKGDRKKAMDKAYRDTHKEEHKEYAAARYQDNKELTKERAVEWANNNPERRSEIRIASRAKHKEARNAHARNYLKTHPVVLEKKKTKTAAWKRKHPENHRATENKRRTAKTQAGGFFTAEEWYVLCGACDFKCLCCEEKKPLEADHVIPVSKGGTSWIENIQPLCKTCNCSKGAKTIDYRDSLGD